MERASAQAHGCIQGHPLPADRRPSPRGKESGRISRFRLTGQVARSPGRSKVSPRPAVSHRAIDPHPSTLALACKISLTRYIALLHLPFAHSHTHTLRARFSAQHNISASTTRHDTTSRHSAHLTAHTGPGNRNVLEPLRPRPPKFLHFRTQTNRYCV